MPNILKDITGQRYGSLVVLSRAEGSHEARWLCRCDCGLERVYVGGKLRRGDCACKCRGGKDKNGDATREPEIHSVWKGIKDRCYRKANKAFPRYGGRGIGVCDEWRLSFSVFCAWAKENGWRQGLEIDRIDNDGDYAPSNCRFVTPKENCRNKSNHRPITFNGRTQLLTEWSEEVGVPVGYLHSRIYRSGWSVERALTTPRRTVAEAARARFKEQPCHS